MENTLVLDARDYPGSDAGVQIAAAIAALPVGIGGRIDATGYTNPQNLTGFTIPPGVTVELGPVLFTLPTASPSIVVQQGARLLGNARNSPGSTTLKAFTGFDKDIITCLSTDGDTGYFHHGYVANLRIDGNKANNTLGHGISVYGIGETTRLEFLNIFNCAQAGLYLKGSASGTGSVDNVTCNACTTYGIQLDEFRSGITLKCIGGDSNPVTLGVTTPRLGGGAILVIDLKSEAVAGGPPDPTILITGGNSKVLLTLLGGNTVTADTGKTLIRLAADNTVNHAVQIIGMTTAGQTILIDDLKNAIQIPTQQVTYHQMFSYCNGGWTRISPDGLEAQLPLGLSVPPARSQWRGVGVDITEALTLVAVPAGGAWTTAATWSPARVPTAADDCVLNNTSGPVTIGTGAVCRSVNLTGYTSTLTHTAGVTWTIGDAVAGLGNVALEFPASGWTYTLGSGSTSITTFVSTSATQQTVNFGGKTTGPVSFNPASGGSWKYTGPHVTVNSNATWNLTKGSLDLNGQTLTLASTFRSNAAANVRSLTLGTAIITCVAVDFGSGVNLAFSGASSTLTLLTGALTFNGGGKTFGNVTVMGGGASSLAIAGANTFTALTVAAPKTVKFTAGTTTTFLTVPVFLSASGNVITIASITAATHTLSLANGTVNADWLNLTNSIATGGAIWGAGGHSVDNGGNSGWRFGLLVVVPSQWRWQAIALAATLGAPALMLLVQQMSEALLVPLP